MKNGAKRLTALLLALVMAGSLAVTPAFADDGEPAGEFSPSDVLTPEDPAPGAEEPGTVTEDETPDNPEDENPNGSEDETPADPQGEAPAEDAGVSKPVININENSFPDDSSVKNGYWITIDADNSLISSAQSVDDLKELITKNLEESDSGPSIPGATGKGSYTASYPGGTVTLSATWTPDPGNQAFSYTSNEWYSFTAQLTVQGGDYSYDFDIDVSPKAHIRIIPKIANQALDPESKTVTAGYVVGTLTDLEDLGLPTQAVVNYIRYTAPQTAAVDLFDEGAPTGGEEFPPAGAEIIHIPSEDFSTFALTGEGSIDITSWEIQQEDGTTTELTLNALQTEAAGVAAGKDIPVTLTPVYAENAFPNWAIPGEPPTFTLTITNKQTKDFSVTVPNVTYGTAPSPSFTDVNSNDVTYYFVGKDGKKYTDEGYTTGAKRLPAGDYRVVATLNSGSQSGSGASDWFTVTPMEVKLGSTNVTVDLNDGSGSRDAYKVKGISFEKEFDGTWGVVPTIKNEVEFVGKLDGDVLGITADGSFGNSRVSLEEGNIKYAELTLTLTGKDADNYTLVNYNSAPYVAEGKITPRPLTIDDSEIQVTQATDGTWQFTGGLKFVGMLNNDITIDVSEVSVSVDDHDQGTVTLSNIQLIAKLTDDDDTYQGIWACYTFDNTGLTLTNTENISSGTCTASYKIPSKPYPKLDTHFTVTIPTGLVYGDGNSHAADVKPKGGVTGLGSAKVTYAKQVGASYDEPSSSPPVDAGTYKVLVSFTETASFAAKANIEAGHLTIAKATDTTSVTVSVEAGYEQHIYLSKTGMPTWGVLLGLPDNLAKGAKFKEQLNDAKVKAFAAVGDTYFAMTPAEAGEETFTITLSSDNYSKITVNVTVKVGEDEPWFVIYANSSHNESLDTLRSFVQAQKPTHTVNGQSINITWGFANNRTFNPKGMEPHDPEGKPWFDWYDYTATLTGSNVKPKAHVTVIPVNATPAALGGNKKPLPVQAAAITGLQDDTDMKILEEKILDLPIVVNVSYEPTMTYQWAAEKFTQPTGTWNITGWKMDGQDLTLSALKTKANRVSSQDMTVTLTPVFDVPAWATVTDSTPTFTLTITPKAPVDVEWDGPDSIDYGGTLDLESSTPEQKAKGDNGTIDETDTFTWEYVYYNADGTTKLSGEPKDAGTYQVKAVLVSNTHSGESALKKFTISPKPLTHTDITVARANEETLTYNKQAQTPEYTVKDGGTELTEGTDYTVEYKDNTNAGPATVTFTGKGNYTGTKTERFTIEKLALTSEQKPTISGTAAAGQVLSASLPDVDSAELEWTWKVGGTEVAGNTGASYAVKPEDSNKTITVIAKAKANGNYSGTSGVSDEKQVSKVTVTGTVAVKMTKTEEGGKTVTATANVSPAVAAESGTWSWKVDGEVKTGATGSIYTILDGEKEIVAVFTPGENYAGEPIESSTIEADKSPLTGEAKITGAGTAVGDTLTASVTDGPELEEGKTFTYTWLRDGTPISGASGNEYTITAADRGKTISVKVTAEDYTGELVSNGTSIPAAVPGEPTVTVTAGDKKLTISWSAPSDNGGAPITGYKLTVKQGDTVVLEETTLAENQTSYTLNDLTNGTEYSVIVKAVNSAGDSEASMTTGTPKTSGGGTSSGGGGGGGGGGGTTTSNPTISSNTTTNPDGGKTTVETKKDGTVTTTVQNKDGSRGTTVTNASGQTTATVQLPSKVASEAAGSGSAVTLPVRGIYASQDISKAPTVTVNASGVKGVKVNIPVVNKGTGVVAVLVKANGTEQLIKNTVPTQDGIAVRLDSGDTVKILDNSKFFADTQGHWAADATRFVSSRELFNGTSPDTFSPNANMTRGMLLTVLARYEDVDTEGGATWYEKGAAWAMINGLSDGTNLNNNITREQLATIMYRYAALKGKVASVNVSLNGYTDASRISDWAVDAMSWAVGVGLIKGTTETTLDPQGSAMRAQVATIIMRYVELYGL